MSGRLIQVTGMGVATPIAAGLHQYSAALKTGESCFSIRSIEQGGDLFSFPFCGANAFSFTALIEKLQLDEDIIQKAKQVKNVSLSTVYGIYCALEAWGNSGLNDSNTDLSKVAIISCGSNTQHGMLKEIYDKYNNRLKFINPGYGFRFFDTDIIGTLSELLKIRGEGYSVGAASASGNMGIINGCRLLLNTEYDVVLVVAPLMDLTVFEYQALTALGAMAPVTARPSAICRPFDKMHNGFVYGQSAGCIILESAGHAARRGKQAYGTVSSYGISMDANRNPNPSVEGEKTAMLKAMAAANITPGQISYINTHGTGSKTGDETEVDALLEAGLGGIKANSTKSLIGHGLSAAGVVEAITTIIQMKEGFLHPTNNLLEPISRDIDWVTEKTVSYNIDHAISNCFGFGGINTAIILSRDLTINEINK